MNEQISVRQTACFCAISLLALKLITLPSLLVQMSTSSAIIVALIMFALDLLLLYLFLKIKEKYQELSLYELIKKVFGSIVAKIIYVILFGLFILKIVMLNNEAISYMRDIVDEDFKILVYFMTFLPVVISMVYFGLKSLARTIEFGSIFIFIGLIFCLFLSEITFTYGEMGPIFKESFSNIFNSCKDVGFWFSDFLFVIILADKIKYQKNMKKIIFGYVGVTLIILIALYIIYIRLFNVTSFLHKDAIADITQYNRNIGNSGNIDIIAILVYMFVIFFQGAIYFLSAKNIYEKIVGYENKIHAIIFITLCILALQLFVFYNLELIINFVFNYLKYFGILVWIIIPLFCICLLIFDRGKSDELVQKKSKQN